MRPDIFPQNEDETAEVRFEYERKGKTEQETIRISKRFYADVMAWDPRDFGSIVRNRGFFQRGVIHNIVDESEFTWKVDEEVEH